MKRAEAGTTQRADVDLVRELYGRRRYCVRAMTGLVNCGKALLRRALATIEPEEPPARIKKRASLLFEARRKGKPPAETKAVDLALEEKTGVELSLTLQALQAFGERRRLYEKCLREAARRLPVWQWAESVRGFGDLGLAILIGEAGDLGNYANPGRLWKRMGLAPKGSYAMETKGGKEAFAVPRRRRSAMWTVGDALIKGGAHYREIYLERKAREEGEHPDLTKLHRHRRAQRYMEKRLLKDLWRAWRNGRKD